LTCTISGAAPIRAGLFSSPKKLQARQRKTDREGAEI
jgi:hypothetical protein